jgi:hypothetical protein
VRAGDQQAASHWYGAYNDQKQIKTNHALIGAYTAADQGDADLSASYFNKYAHLAGLGDKAEVVPHVDPDGTRDPHHRAHLARRPQDRAAGRPVARHRQGPARHRAVETCTPSR